MNIWIDDIRPAPTGWLHIHSVNEFLKLWDENPNIDLDIDIISFDHDAGDYFRDGGDYIKCLDYMDYMFNEYFKDHGWNYNIKYHIHSANPIGVTRMRQIIKKNGWIEVLNLN